MNQFASVQEYRDYLAKIQDPRDIAVHCLNAVATLWIQGNEDTITGTLVGVKHDLMPNFLFGGTYIQTYVKLCPSCVHHIGTACVDPATAEWLPVQAVENIVRNGDTVLVSGAKELSA